MIATSGAPSHIASIGSRSSTKSPEHASSFVRNGRLEGRELFLTDRRTADVRRKRHEQAVDWLLRAQDGTLTEEDRARFELWRAASPENHKAYAAAERLMGDARTAIAGDPTLRNTPTTAGGAGKPIVAGLLVAITAGALFFAFDGPIRLKADMISGKGETPIFTLADGSTIQLNASSAVAEDFSPARRTIRLLKGQAYFEVKADPERPFTVEAGDARVTALGTAFDVRLGSGETDVAVAQHSVLVEFDTPRPAIRLSEGEQIAYAPSSGELTKSPGAKLATSWRNGRLVVENRPLSFVIEELNRKFPGHVVIGRPSLEERRVTGVIGMSDKNAALSFVAKALGVRVMRFGPISVLM
ncbi:FecR family protein [Methylopila musalis]|uniref:FecR family protein n=1 Tax=Methylopila musalis TaxID=1134781 RepID=A0ABW3Z6S2_9HYPH